MAFHPAEVSARPGDTIVWINRDFVPHTATALDSAWTSPPLAVGQRWQMIAEATTASEYLCAFHPVMEARVSITSSNSTEEVP